MNEAYWNLHLELDQLLKKDTLTESEIQRLLELRDQLSAA